MVLVRHTVKWLLVAFLTYNATQRGSGLTLLLRFRQGMQADETALRFPPFDSLAASLPSGALGSFFGRIGRGGITTKQQIWQWSDFRIE